MSLCICWEGFKLRNLRDWGSIMLVRSSIIEKLVEHGFNNIWEIYILIEIRQYNSISILRRKVLMLFVLAILWRKYSISILTLERVINSKTNQVYWTK